MSINFATKNVKMPGALKAYVEKHLLDIEKIAGEIIDAEVIVNEEKLSVPGRDLAEDPPPFVLRRGTQQDTEAGRAQHPGHPEAARPSASKEKIKEEKKRDGAKGISMATVGLVPDKRRPAQGARGGRERGPRGARRRQHPHLGKLLAQADHRRGGRLLPHRKQGERLHVHQLGDEPHGRGLSQRPGRRLADRAQPVRPGSAHAQGCRRGSK